MPTPELHGILTSSAEAEEGILMLVDPAEMDGLVVPEAQMDIYDLREVFSIAPVPAAMPRGADDEDNEDEEESEDDTDESSDDSTDDSDESEDEDAEDDDESTKKLIKDLRTENKKRRLEGRKKDREIERLKSEAARLKKRPTGNRRKAAEEDDSEDDIDEDPAKLTPREEAAEVKSSLVEIMQDKGLDKRYRRIIAALIDPDEVEIKVSDSGKVTVEGLEEAVDDLLEDYPEWQAKDSDEDTMRKSGSSTNRRRRGSGNGLDKATLAKKYPALAGR